MRFISTFIASRYIYLSEIEDETSMKSIGLTKSRYVINELRTVRGNC